MQAHGHTTVWGTHTGVGWASNTKGWYQRLRDWRTAHKATRRQAKLASLNACWDAKHEAVKPLRAEAAPEMAAAHASLSVATVLYGFNQ